MENKYRSTQIWRLWRFITCLLVKGYVVFLKIFDFIKKTIKFIIKRKAIQSEVHITPEQELIFLLGRNIYKNGMIMYNVKKSMEESIQELTKMIAEKKEEERIKDTDQLEQ